MSLPLKPCRMSMLLCAFLLLTHFVSSQTTPPQSMFFSTFTEEAYSTYQMSSGNGDLWPSCWADDGNLYTANSDGNGFGSSFLALQVAQIAGIIPNLTGAPIAGDVGMITPAAVATRISRPAFPA